VTVNLAPMAVQPAPFLALESVPHLGEKSRRPSTLEIADSTLGIGDRRSNRRPSTLESSRNDYGGEIVEGRNRASLPTRR
ncbi:hypothetical protein B296_00035779, partial [Ensete ventricosum]